MKVFEFYYENDNGSGMMLVAANNETEAKQYAKTHGNFLTHWEFGWEMTELKCNFSIVCEIISHHCSK